MRFVWFGLWKLANGMSAFIPSMPIDPPDPIDPDPSTPSGALTWNGVAITWNGEAITYTT